jgi:hypothetical protein
VKTPERKARRARSTRKSARRETLEALNALRVATADAARSTAAEIELLRKEVEGFRGESWRNQAAIARLFGDMLFTLAPRDPRHIVRAAAHSHSQNYEDAIIAEIYRRIGERDRTFLEIGVGDGVECNTRALLERGWTGLWIEADAKAVAGAREQAAEFVENGALRIVEAMVTRENVNALVSDGRGAQPVDFLSLDIDRNTSHVWQALDLPVRVASIEYNAAVPPSIDWEVPYDALAVWDGSNRWGGSLKALERIGRGKGLSLVGCDFHGVNAFFVASDECGPHFIGPYTAEQHFEPMRLPFVGHRGYPAPRKR